MSWEGPNKELKARQGEEGAHSGGLWGTENQNLCGVRRVCEPGAAWHVLTEQTFWVEWGEHTRGGEAYLEGSESSQGCPRWAGVSPGTKRQHHRDNLVQGVRVRILGRQLGGWGGWCWQWLHIRGVICIREIRWQIFLLPEKLIWKGRKLEWILWCQIEIVRINMNSRFSAHTCVVTLTYPPYLTLFTEKT